MVPSNAAEWKLAVAKVAIQYTSCEDENRHDNAVMLMTMLPGSLVRQSSATSLIVEPGNEESIFRSHRRK